MKAILYTHSASRGGAHKAKHTGEDRAHAHRVRSIRSGSAYAPEGQGASTQGAQHTQRVMDRQGAAIVLQAVKEVVALQIFEAQGESECFATLGSTG